jgi:hypothetical protein
MAGCIPDIADLSISTSYLWSLYYSSGRNEASVVGLVSFRSCCLEKYRRGATLQVSPHPEHIQDFVDTMLVLRGSYCCDFERDLNGHVRGIASCERGSSEGTCVCCSVRVPQSRQPRCLMSKMLNGPPGTRRPGIGQKSTQAN